jgi:hypothetical protein
MLGFSPTASDPLGDVEISRHAVVFFEGWSRNSWGSGAWNAPIALPFVATGAVGEVTVRIDQVISVTGLGLTSAVGSVSVTAGAGIDVDVTGVTADGLISPRGVLVWGRIPYPADSDWAQVDPSATNTWSTIAP